MTQHFRWHRVAGWGAFLLLTSFGFGALVADWDKRRHDVNPGDWAVVAQVVPAVVTAVFVFVVGTCFVVAQTVLPTRSGRALPLLLGSSAGVAAVLVAPLLLLGASLLLLDPVTGLGIVENGLFPYSLVALGVGHVFVAGFALMRLFQQAMDPKIFRERLEQRVNELLSPRKNKAAADGLYDLMRTYRGWIRTAAKNGDSRELHEALTGLLSLVNKYLDHPEHHAEPQAYRDCKVDQHTHRCEDPVDRADKTLDPAATEVLLVDWGHSLSGESKQYWYWCSANRIDPRAKPEAEEASLESIWLADEVGRCLVRAVEFGVHGGTLLDRDVFRLLNTLDNAISLLVKKGNVPGSAVLVGHLTEIGLGVRRCDPARADWFYGVLVRLGHRYQDLHGQCKKITKSGQELSKKVAVLEQMLADQKHRQGPVPEADPAKAKAEAEAKELRQCQLHGYLTRWTGAALVVVAESIVRVSTTSASPGHQPLENVASVLAEYRLTLTTDQRSLAEMTDLASSGLLEPREHALSQPLKRGAVHTVARRLLQIAGPSIRKCAHVPGEALAPSEPTGTSGPARTGEGKFVI